MSKENWENYENGRLTEDEFAELEVRVMRGDLLPKKGNPRYRIGNDQIIEKMSGLYGNPKGCQTGEAPKRTAG